MTRVTLIADMTGDNRKSGKKILALVFTPTMHTLKR